MVESYCIQNVCFPVPAKICKIQRVGPSFLTLMQRISIKHASIFSKNSAEQISASDDFEFDEDYLRSLDPKEWKNQDHYAVLGLKLKRFYASDDDIRRAYRKIVLKHHPDKRKAKGEEVKTDDDYFTCITKAYEVLGTQKTRRAYDSVDPEFDDSLPTTTDIEKNFYVAFNKYFSLNARWSERKKVPTLGNESSTREEVDTFYTFWYDFESWREYSYLDEEDKEKGQDREERRWIEKQNKVARIKRKKEEMSRIRSLIDLCYNNDPRILKFKQEDKQKKLAAKRAKMDAVQAAKAEEERVLREAQLAKEKLDQAEQKRIEQIRLEKDQQKKALKKERKVLRDKAKESNYFSTDSDEKIKHMEGVEKICELLKVLELQNVNKELESGGRDAFLRILNEAERKLEAEREALLQNKNNNNTTTNDNVNVKPIDKKMIWSNENVQLLIKAVNLFPAGTAQRWEVIASFLNQHSPLATERKFQSRDVLNKAKNLQGSDFSQNILKVQANQSAFESFEKFKKDLKKIDKAEISVNDDQNEQNCVIDGQSKIVETSDKSNAMENSKIWTKEEQALLEQAIKTYPLTTTDRWDKIAECIPNRTKKDCLKRVKELVERVNAKKQAQKAGK